MCLCISSTRRVLDGRPLGGPQLGVWRGCKLPSAARDLKDSHIRLPLMQHVSLCCSIRIPLNLSKPFILQQCSWKLWSVRHTSVLPFHFLPYYVSSSLICYMFNRRKAIPHKPECLFLTQVDKCAEKSFIVSFYWNLVFLMYEFWVPTLKWCAVVIRCVCVCV